MQNAHEHPPGGHRSKPSRRALAWLATAVLLMLAAACYWYAIDHQSHIARALTWVLVLACPLMHFFGHGHGRHHHGSSGASDSVAPARGKRP